MNNLLNELRKEAISFNLKTLSFKDAQNLKGKRIQTIYFGYANQDGVDDFIVGDIVSEYDIAKKDTSCKNFKNRAEYWENFMTPKQLQEKKDTLELLKEDGSQTFIRSYKIFGNRQHFSCSDIDRYVQYRVVEDEN